MREKKFVVDYCDWDNDEELWTVTDKNLEELQKRFEQLQHQLKVSEKALELACKKITNSCEYCSYKTRIECPVEANCLDEKINYFKTKAKEMMKSDKDKI